MKNTVKLREMERETNHITTVSFQVMFSWPHFLAYFVKLAKKRGRPENVSQFRVDRDSGIFQ